MQALLSSLQTAPDSPPPVSPNQSRIDQVITSSLNSNMDDSAASTLASAPVKIIVTDSCASECVVISNWSQDCSALQVGHKNNMSFWPYEFGSNTDAPCRKFLTGEWVAQLAFGPIWKGLYVFPNNHDSFVFAFCFSCVFFIKNGSWFVWCTNMICHWLAKYELEDWNPLHVVMWQGVEKALHIVRK